MHVNSRTLLTLSALAIASFLLMGQSAQEGYPLSAGESLWMQTSLPAPGEFHSMTFFWHPRSVEGVRFEYVVYRPAGKFGQILHPLGMDLDSFKGDRVIVEFRVLEGSVEFLDPVYVWDGRREGGIQDWLPYTFYFGFYSGSDPMSSVVGYVPGEILGGEPPHGDPIVVYPLTRGPFQSNTRSDFVEAVEVSLDVKPLSCPNPVNTSSRGRIPVALLGSPEFDVRTVDLETVRLEGIAPERFAFDDVAAPFAAEPGCAGCCECGVLPGDGYEDLVLHFDSQAIAEYVSHSGTEECRVLVLVGRKTDGTRFIARDVVTVVR